MRQRVNEARVILVVLMAAAVVLLWWAFDRREPIEMVGRTVFTPVHAGDDLLIRSKVIRRRLCWTRIERFLFDGVRIRTAYEPQENAQFGGLGPDEYTTRLAIPVTAHPGPGTIRFVILWRCNPLQSLWPITRVLEAPIDILPPR